MKIKTDNSDADTKKLKEELDNILEKLMVGYPINGALQGCITEKDKEKLIDELVKLFKKKGVF